MTGFGAAGRQTRGSGAKGMRLWALLSILALVSALQGCGTLYATSASPIAEPVMLLGYDPVAYFTDGKPLRGRRDITVAMPDRTYYFSSWENKRLFLANPAKYEPQYGGFCASGAAYAVKLGSDPTAWQIVDGRLFIFGDIVGHEMWKLDIPGNIAAGDRYWAEARDKGWRYQSLRRYLFKVDNYRTGAQLMAQWRAKNPGKELNYDPGSMYQNLIRKQPGWRAAEGVGQPRLGYPD